MKKTNKKALLSLGLLLAYIIYLFFSGNSYNNDIFNLILGIEPTQQLTYVGESQNDNQTSQDTNTQSQSETISPIPNDKKSLKQQNTSFVQATISLPSCIPAQQGVSAYITHVVDGDTAEVLIDGNTYRVRYLGINTPEYNQFYGSEATAYNEQLLEGKNVMLYHDSSDLDQHGRLLRFIMLDGLFVNGHLVEKGYADAKEYIPDYSCTDYLAELEVYPRTNGIGMWAE